MDWSRRFAVADPNFATVLASTLTPTEQTYAQSALLVRMAKTIRHYSKLLNGAKLEEIYHTIVRDTDYELAFLLLAAKDENRSPLFSPVQVSAMLFGEPVLTNYSEFTDGLTELSCKFAASKLINAFAVVEEQVKAAELLRKQADETLNFVIKAQQNVSKSSSSSGVEDERIKQARLYFEDKEFVTNAELQAAFFLPTQTGSSGWTIAASYPAQTQISVRRIVLDLSLQINNFTLDPTRGANVIASVSQSGEGGYPYLDFALRDYLLGYNADSIAIRFTSGDSIVPFSWGLTTLDLRPTQVNSCILLQRSPKDSRLSTTSTGDNASSSEVRYDCIYFRNLQGAVSTTGNLSYRTSVTSDITETTISTSALIPRYSQEALALIDALNLSKKATNLVGAIVRDDPDTISSGMSAVRIIPWPVTSPITYLVMDILSVPSDIEIALGDMRGPQTAFTNLALSLVCQPLFQRLSSTTSSSNFTNRGSKAEVVSIQLQSQRDLNYDLHERISAITGFNYRRRPDI